jgi:peptidoglycan hydrolase CwlO-like protein
MTDPSLANHATGVELQIEELVVQREQAERDGWPEEIDELDEEIAELQVELGEVAEQVAERQYRTATVLGAETAEELTHHDPANPGVP